MNFDLDQILKFAFVIDIVIFLILLLYLIFGLIGGVKKGMHKLIVLLIPTVLLFIFINPVSKAIVKMEKSAEDISWAIPEDTYNSMSEEERTKEYSIKTLIGNVVVKTLYNNDPEMGSSKAQDLGETVATMIIKIALYVVFLVSLIGIEIILKIIFAILRAILGIKLDRKAHLLGGVCGLARFAIVFCLFILPLMGIVSLGLGIAKDFQEVAAVMPMEETNDNQEVNSIVRLSDTEQPNEQQEMFITLNKIDEAWNNLLVKKIIIKPLTSLTKYKDVPFDAQYVAYGLSFKTEDGTKFTFLEEYANIKHVLPTALKIYNAVSTHEGSVVKLSEFTKEDIETIATLIDGSNLMKIIIPVGCEYGIYMAKKEYPEIAPYVEMLADIDWDAELKTIADAIRTIGDHLDIEIDTSNTASILNSNSVIDLARDFVSKILSMKLITKFALPIGTKVLVNKVNTDYPEYSFDSEPLLTIDWETDLPNLVNFAFHTYEEFISLHMDTSSLTAALNTPNLGTKVEGILNELAEQNLIIDHIVPIGVQIGVAKLSEQIDSIDFDGLKTLDWHTEIPKLASVLHDIIDSYQVLEINPDDVWAVLKNPELPHQLQHLNTHLFESTLVSDYLLPFGMDKLFDSMASNEALNDFNFNYDSLRTYNYSDEASKIIDTLVEVVIAYQELDFDKDNWKAILDDPNLESYLQNIVDKALLSDIIRIEILPKLANKINSLTANNTEHDLSFVSVLITEESIIDLLQNDLGKIIDILKDLNSIGILGGDMSLDFTDEATQDILCDVIKEVFTLSIVEGKEADLYMSILKFVNVEETLANYGVSVDVALVYDWETEIDTLTKFIKDVLGLTGSMEDMDLSNIIEDNLSDERKNQIINVVVDFAGLKSMNSVYTLMSNLINNYNDRYTIEFTELDKAAIENETTWPVELNTLFDLLDYAKEVQDTTDYADLDTTTITNMMTRAADGVIASKLLGQVLGECFGDKIDYDFTSRSAMLESREIVAAAINLAKLTNEDVKNDPDKRNLLFDSLNTLASNSATLPLTNDFLSDILNRDANYTEHEVIEATTILNDVFSQYDAASDKENFDLTDLDSDTLNDLSGNQLAQDLLNCWF